MTEYRCTVCSHRYNPAKGDWMSGVMKNTPFEELPDDWRCPTCGQGKLAFVPVE